VVQLLARTRAAAFVYEDGYGSNPSGVDVDAEIARLPHLRHVCKLEPLRVDAGPTFPRFGGMERRPAGAASAADRNPDRIMYLAFTSGTTGQPKGVMHSDNTLLSNGRAIARDFRFDEETVVYTLSPMSHNMGTVSLVVTLSCGGALVVHGPLDTPRLLDRIRATGATYLVGVPTHGIDLVAQLAPDEPLGNVTCFQLAGSPVPVRLAEALLARGITVQNCFGMTENCSFLYTFPSDGMEVVTTTCGRCAAGMEIAIVDAEDSDRRLGRGEQGEIAIRGSSMMLGYFDDQAATEASYNRDGWFLSGDLGMLDEDGNYRIVGRKKDLIIRGGHNIHPATVEALAMRHPAVGKVAAFPVPDERLGEKMCLAALLEQDARLQAQEMLAHLHDQGLSTYDMPEYFIVMEEFPLTASGKILKRELAAMARDGRITPDPVRWSAERRA
jgi:acyl-CoA synthetase